ncbi:MAG: radical SAM protein [Candidatus Atabeyarchaeum deiterrae]
MGRKVLLVQPPVLYSTWGEYTKPSYLVPLASFIKQNGFDVRILDLQPNGSEAGKLFKTMKEFIDDCENTLNRYDYDILGVSCWTSQHYVPSVLLGLISRVMNPDAINLVGGYHPSILPSDFLKSTRNLRFKIHSSESDLIDIPARLTEFITEAGRHSPVLDYIICGEGEVPLLQICRDEDVEKGKNRKRTRVITGESMEDLNEIDYDYSLLLDDSDGGIESPKTGLGCLCEGIPVYLSRGCPFNCWFCTEKSKGSKSWRSLTPSKSVQIIKNIIDKFNPPFILFADACFGANREWKTKFLDQLVQERNNNTRYWCETSVNCTSREDLKGFSKLPFEIAFGVESGSPKMLDLMNKTTDPDSYLNQHRKLIDACIELSIPAGSYFIWGFPGETEQTLGETLRYQNSLLRIGEDHPYIDVAGQFFCLFPGSHVYENMEYYSKEFGAVFRVQDWWKYITRDFRKMASQVDPSRALSLAEETEMVSYEFMIDWNRLNWNRARRYRWASAKSSTQKVETPDVFDFNSNTAR